MGDFREECKVVLPSNELEIRRAKTRISALLHGTWMAPIRNIKNENVEEMEFEALSFSEVEEYVEGLVDLRHANSSIISKKEEILELLKGLKTEWKYESSKEYVNILYNAVLKLKNLMINLGWIIVPSEQYERYESCLLIRFRQSG